MGSQYRPFEGQFRAARHACFVDGAPILATALTVREMNFGQHFRTPGLPLGRYEVRVDAELVAAFLVEELRDFREMVETEAEADLTVLERELRARGWPSSREIVADAALGPAVVRQFAYELVLSFLSTPREGSPRWVINSVTDVAIGAGDVTLRGEVGRADLRSAYQDY
jgi:hypothetical protein